MGLTERRERDKEAFRERVLDAARTIVLKEGFAALSMRKIADAIEYAPGTIYLYFENRDAIARELTREAFTTLLVAFEEVASTADPAERLARFGEQYIRFGLSHPESYQLIFMREYNDVVFEENAEGERALELLVHAFDELRESGRLVTSATSAELADAFWAGVHGVMSLKMLCGNHPKTSLDRLASVMNETLLRGIALSPQS